MVLLEQSQACWAGYASQIESDADAAERSESAQSDGTGIDIGSLSRCSSISSTLLAPAGLMAALSAQKKVSTGDAYLALAPVNDLMTPPVKVRG